MPPVLETVHLDAVIDRMDAHLAVLARTGDRRERFLLMYRTFKHELRRHLRDGRFTDVEWSEAICCRMGEMYFEADTAYRESPARSPAPWAHAFDSAARRRTHLLQDMLLGMNAHINYDLPLCTYDTMSTFGDVEDLRDGAETSLRFRGLLRRRYHDFLLINEIAWESIPLIQDVVTERFSRLLKYANLMTFGLSRPIAERIICEYRDRAWAHTLVLLTAGDAEDAAAARRHLSLFALRTGDLVERLSLNPLRHLRRRAPEPLSMSAEPVARMLVEHLAHRATRAIARQALIEYGDEVQPLLIRTLNQAPPAAAVRSELYGILAARPTRQALEALLSAVPGEREARGELLAALADHGTALRQGPVSPTLVPTLMTAARQELGAARGILALAGALERGTDPSTLLSRALRHRAHRALLAAGSSLTAAGRPTAVATLADATTGEVPGIAALLRRAGAIATAVGASPVHLESPSPSQAIAQLLEDGDPWLRAAALWWVAVEGDDPEPLQRLLLEDDHELVRETALRGLARLLPGAGSREAARRLIARSDGGSETPARMLARQIVQDQERLMTTIEKVLHLKNVALFQDILAEELVPVARVAHEHRFAAGDSLITRDAPGIAAFVVVEGAVNVIGAAGQRLATVGPGGVLGEMSVVSDMPTSADCVADSAGRALRIARKDFHALLQDHPSTAIGVLNVLAQRLRDTNTMATVPIPAG